MPIDKGRPHASDRSCSRDWVRTTADLVRAGTLPWDQDGSCCVTGQLDRYAAGAEERCSGGVRRRGLGRTVFHRPVATVAEGGQLEQILVRLSVTFRREICIRTSGVRPSPLAAAVGDFGRHAGDEVLWRHSRQLSTSRSRCRHWQRRQGLRRPVPLLATLHHCDCDGSGRLEQPNGVRSRPGKPCSECLGVPCSLLSTKLRTLSRPASNYARRSPLFESIRR
jgi:hypothetical protein